MKRWVSISVFRFQPNSEHIRWLTQFWTYPSNRVRGLRTRYHVLIVDVWYLFLLCAHICFTSFQDLYWPIDFNISLPFPDHVPSEIDSQYLLIARHWHWHCKTSQLSIYFFALFLSLMAVFLIWLKLSLRYYKYVVTIKCQNSRNS